MSADHPVPPRQAGLLTLRDVANLLGVNERHVRRLVFERRIPYIKWGRLLRFDPVDIHSWIDASRCNVASSSRGSR